MGFTSGYYKKAAENTILVGNEIEKLLERLGVVTTSLVHCIGHSLGAHVCGFLGKNVNSKIESGIFKSKLGRVTGLDPAGPLFLDKGWDKGCDSHLCHTDAM